MIDVGQAIYVIAENLGGKDFTILEGLLVSSGQHKSFVILPVRLEHSVSENFHLFNNRDIYHSSWDAQEAIDQTKVNRLLKDQSKTEIIKLR